MRGTHYVTIEELGHASSLEVEIEFLYTPGERMVMYYPNGDGYPGSPPEVEFISAHVFRWDVGFWKEWDERKRGSSWIWDSLDRIATRIVSEGWERFQEGCLESMDERIRDRGYDE